VFLYEVRNTFAGDLLWVGRLGCGYRDFRNRRRHARGNLRERERKREQQWMNHGQF